MNGGDRPWMEALEKQFAALGHAEERHVLATMSEHGHKGFTDDDGSRFRFSGRGRDESRAASAEAPPTNRLRRIHTLRGAETFAWTPDIIGAVAAAARTIPIGSGLNKRP
jgi:hypothetical protein